MDAPRFDAILGAAITGSTHDRSALRTLSAACWPTTDDRTVPVARRWMSLWGPHLVTAEPHVCAGAGPCGHCN